MTALPHAARLRLAHRHGTSALTWLSLGIALGFLVPFVFADVLEIQRDLYYAIYASATFALFGAWLHVEGRSLRSLLAHRWAWGIGLGLVAGAVLVLLALGAEDSTAHPDGLRFAVAIFWRGIVYGAVDGLLLSVFPILVVYAALEPHRRRLLGKLAVGLAALTASLSMTAAYHVGYSDFRSGKLGNPVAGDVMWSLPTLATASPVGAPIAHAALHVTAVMHSYDTDLFLPPHQPK